MATAYNYQLSDFKKARTPEIYARARGAADEVGMTADLRMDVGLTGAVSGCHGLLTDEVNKALEDGSRKVIPNSVLNNEVRQIVKDVYGDEWDAALISTCEAALWVSFDTLCTPPSLGRGDNYRARYIAPYERHMHHQAGYGRPFPPRYKDLWSDRGVTGGELGFYGKRLNNLDTVIVPLEGAEYPCHGIKYFASPFLTQVDADASRVALATAAEIHRDSLTGFASLGYDSPGYGYAQKGEDGSPTLQRHIGDLARQYNVPYISDNAWGLPFVGTDPRKTGADVMMYSMDKAAGGPTCGLIVGREEVMVHIRRALGIHGERSGSSSSHGKAAYVTADPGKEALLGAIAALKVLRDRPQEVTAPLDDLFDIVTEEFGNLEPRLQKGWSFFKSTNSGAVEINYEATWQDGEMGFPVFTIEDMYAGSHVIQGAMAQMGIIPTIAYDGNIFISPGLGTTDAQGGLIEERTRPMIKALVRIIEIIDDELQKA